MKKVLTHLMMVASCLVVLCAAPGFVSSAMFDFGSDCSGGKFENASFTCRALAGYAL